MGRMSRGWCWLLIGIGQVQAFGIEHGWPVARTAGVSRTADYLTGIAFTLVGFLCWAIVFNREDN